MYASYIRLQISVEGSLAVLCGEISQINGVVHLVHPAATCLCSFHPFSLSSCSLSGPRQCLICIIHHRTQQTWLGTSDETGTTTEDVIILRLVISLSDFARSLWWL